jgi:thiaminase (transcriptional activator TenA)
VTTNFSEQLWRTGAPTYDAIRRHPFITGLTDGSLSHDAFRYFVVQDSHYLRAYSRALTLVAGRAVDDGDVQMFARHAADAIEVATTGTYAEAVAAVLPCYWIYRDVGRELAAASSPDPVYKRWIETYASEEFDAVVEAVLAVTDRLGESLGPAERERCHRHFAVTCRYEWMFWDAAYRQLPWPI